MFRSPEDIAAWRRRYQAATEALQQVAAEELAALSDDEALRRTLSLRLFVPTTYPPSTWSGLVFFVSDIAELDALAGAW